MEHQSPKLGRDWIYQRSGSCQTHQKSNQPSKMSGVEGWHGLLLPQHWLSGSLASLTLLHLFGLDSSTPVYSAE